MYARQGFSSPDSPGSPSRPAEPPLIDLHSFFRGLRERWFGTLVCAVVVCGLAGYWLLRQPPVYASGATLLVERSTDRVIDIKQVVDTTVDSSLTDALLLTHIQQIRSPAFLTKVAGSLQPEEHARTTAPYTADRGLLPGADEESPAREFSVEDLLADNLEVERVGRTLLIDVTVRHRDPEIAALLANRVAERYIVHLLDRSSASNDSALAFLTRQVDELRGKLETSEEKAQAYREEHNLVSIDNSRSIGAERLRTLSAAVTEARVVRLALDARLGQVEAILEGSGDLRQLASEKEFALFANVQKQLDDLQGKRGALSERYGRMHPSMIENASSIETLERQREQQLAAALADLRNRRDKASIEEEQLREEMVAAEKESLRTDQLSNDYNVLHREVERTREMYSQILARLNETTISSRLQNTNIKLAGRAGVPVRPVEPNRTKVLAILGLLGATVVVGYPWLTQKRDQRVKGWSDVEGYLGSTLIGELPDAKGTAEADRAWIVARSIDSNVVEAFRGLYCQFRLSSTGSERKMVVVTSTIPGEGKSFVAANLAASFAAHGCRTLLVDADLRRPTLHRAFGLDNKNGILTRLEAAHTCRDPLVLRAALGLKELAPGLHLLRTGGESQRLTEFLQQEELRKLFAELREQYDVVLVDTSPAGVFPDAEIFSGLADELIFVCRFKGAQRAHARQTLERLRKTRLALRGVVLNALPPGRRGAYYMTSYGQGAGHYRRGYSPKG